MGAVWKEPAIDRRRFLATGAGVLLVASLPKLVLAQEDWKPQQLVTPDNPFISENGGPRFPSLITDPLQIPPGSPAKLRLVMSCKPLSEEVDRASGGFIIASGPLGEYGPMTTNWLAITWFRRAYGVVQDQGEGSKNGIQLTDSNAPLPETQITLESDGTYADVEIPEIQRSAMGYPLLRPLLGESNPDRLLYFAAFSNRSRTTIHSLELLTKQ